MIVFEPLRGSPEAPPLTDQIVTAVEEAVRDQRLRPGMRVPSVRQFARRYGVSTFTVAAAYSRLVAASVLVARPGSGHRVAPPPRPLPRSEAPANWTPPAVGASWLLADVFADHSIPIKSGCGWLPPEWLNESGMRQALRQLLRTPASQMGGYGHPYGYYPLREHIARSLEAHGFNVLPDEVLLMQGATQALDVIIRSLLRPGDAVLIEVPAYANLLHALRMAGTRVLGVERNTEGLCPVRLEQLARSHDVKALFVSPVLHNPTGTSLTMNNAFRILQLAERYDFWVIEDDVSRDLLPGIGPLLAAMAGMRRVVYVSGFSKSITPAMRVGYIVAGHTLIQELATTKMAIGLTTPEIMERTVHQVLLRGQHQAHLLRIQDRLREAHDVLTERLDQHAFEVFARPRAGLFLWARPRGWAMGEGGATRLAGQALKHGIWLAPGTYFYPQGQQAAAPESRDPEWIRFNVAYSQHADLWSFMDACRAAHR